MPSRPARRTGPEARGADEDSRRLGRGPRAGRPHPRSEPRGRVRGRRDPVRRAGVRGPRRPRDRRRRQARRTGLHRHARPLRSPRFAPADQRRGPRRLLRAAVPRDQRAEGRHARSTATCAISGPTRPARRASCELHALFTVAELLAQRRHDLRRVRQPAPHPGGAAWSSASTLGVRGYLGPGYDSRPLGRRRARAPEARRATRRTAGASSPARSSGSSGTTARAAGSSRASSCRARSRRAASSCLRATRENADELGLPMATHAAYSIVEFYEIVREHRTTPIELLDELGMLRPDAQHRPRQPHRRQRAAQLPRRARPRADGRRAASRSRTARSTSSGAPACSTTGSATRRSASTSRSARTPIRAT